MRIIIEHSLSIPVILVTVWCSVSVCFVFKVMLFVFWVLGLLLYWVLGFFFLRKNLKLGREGGGEDFDELVRRK